MRILWKYIDKHTRDVYFSWVRWHSREGYWEFRMPPKEYNMSSNSVQKER